MTKTIKIKDALAIKVMDYPWVKEVEVEITIEDDFIHNIFSKDVTVTHDVSLFGDYADYKSEYLSKFFCQPRGLDEKRVLAAINEVIEENLSITEVINREEETIVLVEKPNLGIVNQFINVSGNKILPATKELLLNDHADYSAVSYGNASGLFFTMTTLESFLEEDYFDEENKPSAEVLFQVKKLLKEMRNANANLMFLN